jgi:hypothetical protein
VLPDAAVTGLVTPTKIVTLMRRLCDIRCATAIFVFISILLNHRVISVLNLSVLNLSALEISVLDHNIAARRVCASRVLIRT